MSEVVHEEAWQPADYLAELKERESGCREMIDLLQWKSEACEAQVWRRHLPKMIERLQFFAGLYRDEIDHYGEWRPHEMQMEEFIDILDEDLEELAAWLKRMVGGSG